MVAMDRWLVEVSFDGVAANDDFEPAGLRVAEEILADIEDILSEES